MNIKNKNQSEKFSITLACVLTTKEFTDKSKELAQMNFNREEFEDRKKEVTKEYGSKIASCETQINVLSKIVSAGEEHRDVEVFWKFDFGKNTKQLIRVDTGAVHEEEAITSVERQTMMDFEKKEKEDVRKKKEKEEKRKGNGKK